MSDTTTSTAVHPPEVIERAERRLREMLERSERQLLELESNLTGVLRDQDTIQEDKDGVRLVVSAIRGDVLQTRRALARIADGTYGRCVSCGNAIPAERLEAIPTVERCARCA